MTSIQEELNKEFAPSQIRGLKKGGTTLDYVPIAEVIARLNALLGTENWGEEAAEAWRDPSDPDWIVAKATVWAYINGSKQPTYKIGYGGQKIKRTKAGDILDLGDEYKGAHSDAFKKACTKFGIGLHLARDESAVIQEAHDNEVRARAEAKAVEPDVRDLIQAALSGLDESEKTQIKANWQGSEVPPLSSDGFTEEHAKLVAPWVGVKLP